MCSFSCDCPLNLRVSVLGGKAVHDSHGFDADADDLADEADDVFLIIGVVGVAGDAAAFVGADLVLVDDPIEGAAVAEAVVEDLGRDFGEGALQKSERQSVATASQELKHSQIPQYLKLLSNLGPHVAIVWVKRL